MFGSNFLHYTPTEDELKNATTHSEQQDNGSHQLEKRFGHPSLHADLFTPMLYANMIPLLKEVYTGEIDDTFAKLHDFGGEERHAQVVPGGVMFTGVELVRCSFNIPQLLPTFFGHRMNLRLIRMSTPVITSAWMRKAGNLGGIVCRRLHRILWGAQTL